MGVSRRGGAHSAPLQRGEVAQVALAQGCVEGSFGGFPTAVARIPLCGSLPDTRAF
jgi:hypothetical protein